MSATRTAAVWLACLVAGLAVLAVLAFTVGRFHLNGTVSGFVEHALAAFQAHHGPTP